MLYLDRDRLNLNAVLAALPHFQQAKLFAYNISNEFLFIGKDKLREAGCIDVPGPYEITDQVLKVETLDCALSMSPEVFQSLVDMASSLRKDKGSLSKPLSPGIVNVLRSNKGHYNILTVFDPLKSEVPTSDEAPLLRAGIPSDIELTSQDGHNIAFNRQILEHYGLIDKWLGAFDESTSSYQAKLDFEDMKSDILNGDPESPADSESSQSEEENPKTVPTSSQAANTKPQTKKARLDSSIICTFLVGPGSEVITANRPVLAQGSPVLCKMLYGTGAIAVDFDKPIVISEFKPAIVKADHLAMWKWL